MEELEKFVDGQLGCVKGDQLHSGFCANVFHSFVFFPLFRAQESREAMAVFSYVFQRE